MSLKIVKATTTFCVGCLLAFALYLSFSALPAYADNEADPTTPAVIEQTEGTWQKTASGWKYLTSEDAQTGFVKVSGKVYYLDPSTGIMKTGWLKLDNDWYYFNNSGAMATGWKKVKGIWYYLEPANGKMAKGKHAINGATYYLAASGAMKTGWNKEDGIWYHYKKSGAMTTGWLKSGGKWYYLDPANGKMATGKYKAGNSWYISNSSGAMYANKWVKLSEGWYYPNASGALKTGWLKTGGKWYWLQPEKDGLMIADALTTVKNVRYSFTSSGAMRANCQVKLENNEYGYAASSGAISTIGAYEGDKVILKDVQGETLTGWQKIGGTWFYADANGVMQTGWVKTGGKWYWLASSGAMATNTWVDGGKYYVGSDGAWVQVNIIKDFRSQFSHGTKTAKHQKYIVIHDTEGGGTPQNVIAGWASNGRRVAAHFVIGKDGTIVQCVPLDQIAHHAGYGNRGHNAKFGVAEDGRDDMKGTTPIGSYCPDYGMNSYSIGIELIHRGSSGEAYPKAQLEALNKLIAHIDSYYGFESTIIDHKTWRIGNSDTSKEFAKYLANYRDHRTYN